MRLCKPSFEIWDQEKGLEGIYKQIERAGRICYASDPIEGKAKTFVDRMIKLGHGAVLEHGTVYLQLNNTMSNTFPTTYKYEKNGYSAVVVYENKSDLSNRDIPYTTYNITTNYRVLLQGDYKTWDEAQANDYDKNWLDDLQYLCEPTEYHAKRVTVHFTTQIAITREYNRHRVNSMAEQSTRYCDYTDGKKFEGVGINLPDWITPEQVESSLIGDEILANDKYGTLYERETYNWDAIDWWLWANKCCEVAYHRLIDLGWIPQQARTVLPLDTNSELVHTAFISDWEHFFVLRDDKQHAHPDAFALAHPLHEEFISRGYVNV